MSRPSGTGRGLLNPSPDRKDGGGGAEAHRQGCGPREGRTGVTADRAPRDFKRLDRLESVPRSWFRGSEHPVAQAIGNQCDRLVQSPQACPLAPLLPLGFFCGQLEGRRLRILHAEAPKQLCPAVDVHRVLGMPRVRPRRSRRSFIVWCTRYTDQCTMYTDLRGTGTCRGVSPKKSIVPSALFTRRVHGRSSHSFAERERG